MPEPSPSSPDTPSAGPSSEQPLLEGLDARRLVAGMLEDTGSMPLMADWEAPTAEALAELLVGFEVKRMLGRGGMGAVYLATETRLGRPVAIKLLPPELGQRPDFRQRFEREAWVLAQLDHPYIVRLYGLGESEGGHLYLVMEYIEGTSLADLLNDARAASQPGVPAVPWPRCVRIMGQLCEALAHAHAQGLIHRDLKPANVLLTADETVKLADFGLARAVVRPTGGPEGRALMTQTGQLMGTYDYMAPEQRDGLPGDHRVDIYGLGVLLYQLLTGSLPRGAFSPPSALVGTGPAVDRLVLRALATAPEARTPTAETLRSEMLACPSHGGRSWMRHPAVRTAAALLVGGGVVAAGWSGLTRGPGDPSQDPADAAAPVAGAVSQRGSTPSPEARVTEERRSFLGHVLRALPDAPTVFIADAQTTVTQYRLFVNATSRPATPAQWVDRVGDPLSEVLTWENPGRPVTDDEPVVGVSWHDAHDFCHWMTRRARAAGELQPGQEYRLPMILERLSAQTASVASAPGSPGSRLEEWLFESTAFNRLWHAAFLPRPPDGAGGPLGSRVSALNNGGHSGRGFRIVLDLKTPALLPVSARLIAAAEGWGDADDGRAPVGAVVTPTMVWLDITRRPEITTLEPIRGLGITEFWAAPATPLDLAPLAGQPLESAFLGGPVVSLEPLAGSPLVRLSIGDFQLVPPVVRRPPPSLIPLLGQRRLTHLSWRCQMGAPDVPLREFPSLAEFAAWDCELGSLQFLAGASINTLTIDRTPVDLQTNRNHLSRIRKLERTEYLLTQTDAPALAGNLAEALVTVDALHADLSEMRWFDSMWHGSLSRRQSLWSEWQSKGMEPWWRAGAIGPPPGSVEWRGRWFYLLETAVTRTEAEFYAATWGGYLATLADPEEEAFVRASVLPARRDTHTIGNKPVRAHVGGWRASAAGPWQWVTGEPWNASDTREIPGRPAAGFLVLASGAEPGFAECTRQQTFPALIEWDSPEENSALRALESRLLGNWSQDDGREFELRPRGQVGPEGNPGDRWFVVEAGAGKVLLARLFGRNPVLLTTTPDADRLVVTRPDGSTGQALRRH